MRYVELRRHTDNDGDKLSEEGMADAEEIGQTGLHPPYAAFVSTGAERATEMLAHPVPCSRSRRDSDHHGRRAPVVGRGPVAGSSQGGGQACLDREDARGRSRSGRA